MMHVLSCTVHLTLASSPPLPYPQLVVEGIGGTPCGWELTYQTFYACNGPYPLFGMPCCPVGQHVGGEPYPLYGLPYTYVRSCAL